MIPLILFVLLGLVILVLFEVRARKQAREQDAEVSAPAGTSDEGCCGQHLVCERETLLQTNAEIIYYDDEELDALAGTAPENFTEEQHQMVTDVFQSLMEKDVPGWCRSLQLRNIALPHDIREEALMIVRERRTKGVL